MWVALTCKAIAASRAALPNPAVACDGFVFSYCGVIGNVFNFKFKDFIVPPQWGTAD